MVELGMGLLRRVEVREGGRRLLRVEAAVVEGLGVRVKDLACLFRVRSGVFLAREHHRARVAPFVVQHFALPASFLRDNHTDSKKCQLLEEMITQRKKRKELFKLTSVKLARSLQWRAHQVSLCNLSEKRTPAVR